MFTSALTHFHGSGDVYCQKHRSADVPSVFMWLSVTDHGMWPYAQCLNLQMLQN